METMFQTSKRCYRTLVSARGLESPVRRDIPFDITEQYERDAKVCALKHGWNKQP